MEGLFPYVRYSTFSVGFLQDHLGGQELLMHPTLEAHIVAV